jgi:hypothetical protein
LSTQKGCLAIFRSVIRSQLVDNGDGTISDMQTGLMWKKCVEGVSGNGCAAGSAASFNWQQALEQPGTVNSGEGFAGYHDWRLPNIKELTSIVEEQCSNPAINSNRFPNTPSSYVWSGSPYANYSGLAWYVDFGNGYSYGGNRSVNDQVRLVRDGQ